MNNWLKYIIELIVITFSILAAFWLENLREEMKEEKQRKEALTHIVNEIKYNRGSSLRIIKH